MKKINAEYYDSDLLWEVVFMLTLLGVIQDISHTCICLLDILDEQDSKRYKDVIHEDKENKCRVL